VASETGVKQLSSNKEVEGWIRSAKENGIKKWATLGGGMEAKQGKLRSQLVDGRCGRGQTISVQNQSTGGGGGGAGEGVEGGGGPVKVTAGVKKSESTQGQWGGRAIRTGKRGDLRGTE